jgi:hypothetical protein
MAHHDLEAGFAGPEGRDLTSAGVSLVHYRGAWSSIEELNANLNTYLGVEPSRVLEMVGLTWANDARALLASRVLDRMRTAPPGSADHVDMVVSDGAYCLSPVLRELVRRAAPACPRPAPGPRLPTRSASVAVL